MKMKFDIIGALKVVAGAIGVYIGIYILTLIGMIITGVLVNTVASGNIEVDNLTAHRINSTASTLTGLWVTLTSGVSIAIGLVVLVVVLTVFKGFFQKKEGGGRKSPY
jgi:hypothetical protein